LTDATTEQAARLNRRFYLIAESDANDARLIRSRDLGGYGLHSQWSDDLHHALHTVLTGERDSYYQDFGGFEQLAKAYREGFVYTGQYSRSRRRRHGSSSRAIPAERFVICTQNHDQVGNRMQGDRLSQALAPQELQLAAATVILSPYLPLLFMGEEYGETAPFQYFTSHEDPALAEAVRSGRREEFAAFRWQGEVPDPQAEQTFLRSKLDHDLAGRDWHKALREFYQELIRLRKTVPALARLSKDEQEVLAFPPERVLVIRRWTAADAVCLILNFNRSESRITLPAGEWHKLLDSSAPPWREEATSLGGRILSDGQTSLAIPPHAIVLFESKEI